MRTQTDWTQLGRYVAGECSREERDAIAQRLMIDPALSRDLRAAAAIWTAAPRAGDDAWDVDALTARLRRRLADDQPVRPTRMPARHTRRMLNRAALAAGFALVAALAQWHGRRAASPAIKEVATRVGERTTVPLPDGSTVTLAPSSRLTIPSDFGTRRDVRLDGQAYFDVAPDSAHPFVVHAANATMRVLGTDFVVRTYPGESQVEVVVVHGRVAVRGTPSGRSGGAGRETVVAPRERALVGTDGSLELDAAIDVAPYVAWTDGHLSFDHARLDRVAAELERWYGVRVRVADASLAPRKVTAMFTDPSPDRTLQLLALSLGAQMERQGDAIVIRQGRRR